MKARSALGILAFIVILFSPCLIYAFDQAPAASKSVECHNKVTPNIVNDWKLSKHSQAEITCAECHDDQHSSANDVAKVKMPRRFAIRF
jgi:hypothetical protein